MEAHVAEETQRLTCCAKRAKYCLPNMQTGVEAIYLFQGRIQSWQYSVIFLVLPCRVGIFRSVRESPFVINVVYV